MKRLSIALAAALAISTAAPAMAADYIPAPPPPPPAPMTCMDYVNAHYGAYTGFHGVLAAPFYAVHALGCHVFHHDGYGYGY